MPLGAIVLAGDQAAMPAEERLRRKQRPDLAQQIAPQFHRHRGKPAFFGDVQNDPTMAGLFPQFLSQNAVLLLEVLNHILLLSVYPASQRHHDKLPRVYDHGEHSSE